MNKFELRRSLRIKRLGMSFSEVVEKSLAVTDNIIQVLEPRPCKNILMYQSMVRLNEVDTRCIGDRLRQMRPEISIKLMEAHPSATMPTEKFDVIIVPMLGFDGDNFRLGWGGGFYDRFLAKQPEALKIGLCFQNCFVSDGLPHEAHDIPMDVIVTDQYIWKK